MEEDEDRTGDQDETRVSENDDEESDDSRREPGEGVPDISPEPGMTAPLDHLRPEEEHLSPAGGLPGGDQDDEEGEAESGEDSHAEA
jgi:hypothetical protein